MDGLCSSWSEEDSLWMAYTPHGARETHYGWPILLMERGRLIMDGLYSSWSEEDSLWMAYTPNGARETRRIMTSIFGQSCL